MTTIVTRAAKGSPLTNNEVDANAVNLKATADAALPKSGGAMTGAITTNSTFDGVDIATRDAVLTSTTTTANAALPKAGGAMTGAITTNSTFDGRDVATDGTKLDGIEASATADQTGAQIKTAYEAETNAFTDAQFTKLGGIEALATVTNTASVTAAGALMDSELTSIASVKALNQGVATGDSPTFAALTSTGEITANGGIALGDNDKATFGDSDDLRIYHNGNSFIDEVGTGDLYIRGSNNIYFDDADGTHRYAQFTSGGAVKLRYDNSPKFETTSTGIDVTGTATMDALTSSSTIKVDHSGALPSAIQVGDLTTLASDTGVYFRTTGIAHLTIPASGNLCIDGTTNQKFANFSGNGDISFYENTGSSPKFFWDASAERLGLGTTSPQRPFHLHIGTDNTAARFQSTDTEVALEFIDPAGTAYFRASGDYIKMGATQSDSLTILDGGNVGIGGPTPLAKMHIFGNGSVRNNFQAALIVDAGVAVANPYTGHGTGINFKGRDYSNVVRNYAAINAIMASNNSHSTPAGDAGFSSALTFTTNGGGASGTNPTERMRLSGSNLLLGTTSAAQDSGAGVKLVDDGTNGRVFVQGGSQTSGEGYSLHANGAYRFYVSYSGAIFSTSTSITQISDVRLKENIRDLDDGLAKVMQLQPRKFDWKEGKGKDVTNDRGFIAQEFEQVFPDLVNEWKDEAPEGEEPYKAVSADLIPTLVKAIQEQQTLIESLTTRIAALEE